MVDEPTALAELTVIGKDRKGVIADITNFIFTKGGNIENVNQKVTRGLFGMHLEASFHKIDRVSLDKGLMALSKKLNMEIRVHYDETKTVKKIYILYIKKTHTLEKILYFIKQNEINANISVI